MSFDFAVLLDRPHTLGMHALAMLPNLLIGLAVLLLSFPIAKWDRVPERVKAALSAHGIDLPFPTCQVLFHDQTEATDGDRRRQREGWPAGDGEVPEQAGLARVLADRPVREGN